jgi:hypothetical protein
MRSHTHHLRWISRLAALVMASEAGAVVLLPDNFAAGLFPVSVAVADLDGDAVPDIVAADLDGNRVSVLLGNGDGTLQTRVFFRSVGGPSSIAVGDLDGDTAPDLVTANYLRRRRERAAGQRRRHLPGRRLLCGGP